MLTEGTPAGANDLSFAKSRVQNGPPPDWVVQTPYDAAYKSTQETPVTFLLFDWQIQAEQNSLFVHEVIRLETMPAVQHWSQWRLQFEPKSQLVTLHSLKVRRGDVEMDQSNLAKSHLLQREEGLDHFVIHGWFTLLMVLEDVRPGDILDFSYTIRTESSLFPNQGGTFYNLPQNLPVGRYYFAVQFSDARPRRWKSSRPALTPVEKKENGMTFWEWSGEKFVDAKPEVNCPPWHVYHTWVQVSDFSDWQEVGSGIARAWEAREDGEAVVKMARDIQAQAGDLAAQIEKALEVVQDDCRYLSINVELGGHTPASPGTVARRRYGDCKDLSFLLANLLKELGVKARPILVNTFLRKAVADFLPMPSMFNHVVVEFEADGQRRWVDTTIKEQGGGPFKRFIPEYGLGLPVDAAGSALVEPPRFDQVHSYELCEHVLLDTANGASLMAVTLVTEGSQAEQLRRQLKERGVEEWGKQRTQYMANRFGDVKRSGEIKYRDDRTANRFTLVEVFEIKFVLGGHSNPKLCRFNLPGNWLAGLLPMPPKTERNTPYLLPHPCSIQYTASIDSSGIQGLKLTDPCENLGSPFVQFSRESRGGHGFFVLKLSLSTKADSVPADQVAKHGQLLEQIGRAACRELTLLQGHARSRPRAGFDSLPPERTASAAQPPPLPVNRNFVPAERQQHRHRRSTSSRSGSQLSWRAVWIIVVLVVWGLIALIRAATGHGP
ncbi:MAG TPA: DUF3857 domain-containing protein [Verrucomicrobiae bacterium]